MNLIRKYSKILCPIFFWVELVLLISLFIPVSISGKAIYDSIVARQILPAFGCTSMLLSMMNVKPTFIFMGFISTFAFYIVTFTGYILK